MAGKDKKKDKVPLGIKMVGFVIPKNPAKHRTYTKVLAKTLMGSVIKKDDVYFAVPKDNVIQVDTSLEYKNSFLPSKLIHHFIDAASHHAIAKYCACRTRMDCTNHPKEYGCLLLGEGVVDGNNNLRHVSLRDARFWRYPVEDAWCRRGN